MSSLIETMQSHLTIMQHHLPLVDWYSAGKQVYIATEGGRKKQLAIPHKDGSPINSQTNTLKMQLNNQYLVIDADAADLVTLAKLYPSITSTFATQTTDKHKRHYYFQAEPTLKGIRKTHLDADGEYDIFTYGIMFEGHTIPEQYQPWKIVQDLPVAKLTEHELVSIRSLTKLATKNTNMQAGVYFLDKEAALLVEQSLKDTHLPKSKADHKKLLFAIMNNDFRDANKSKKARIDWPAFNHINFNTMAYKLSYNMAIAHTTRDSMLNLILTEAYEIDPNSAITAKHLDQSILATLPRHDTLEEISNAETFRETITHTVMDGWALVKFVNNRGELNYLEISPLTFKARVVGEHDTAVLKESTVCAMRQYSKEDLQLVPRVKVIVNPYMGPVGFEDHSNIDTINLSQQSEYFEKAVPVEKIDDNVVTRLIHSYLGEHKEFYYHWLAHLMYSHRSPQTVPMFVSTAKDKGSTGKSTLTQAIVSRLVVASGTADPAQTESGWGDLVSGRKIVCFNDMKPMAKKEFGALNAFIKDNTTSGARRVNNMKFGGFVVTTGSICVSISANWIPPVEDHDRRFWVVFPQSQYGTPQTPLLSDNDATELNLMMEGPIDTYHPELQSLANYCKYLYEEHRDKHYKGLYIERPKTEYWEIATQQQKNYSESILPALVNGPQALTDLIGDDRMRFISQFLLLQYSDGYVYLPTDFMAMLLRQLHPEDESKLTKNKIASKLQIESIKFDNRGSTHTSYKTVEGLSSLSSTDAMEAGDYSQQQLKWPMKLEEVTRYQDYLEGFKPTQD